MSKTRTILAVLLLLNTCISMAQDNSTKQWTLKECVEYALDNNLTVQRSLLNVQSSDINYNQSKMALLPSLNANGSGGYNWGRSIDPTSNLFVTERTQFYGAGANASVSLFNGFSMRNTINQNKLAFEASQYDLEKSKNDIIEQVILFYVSVIFNQELLKNAKSKLLSSDQQLKRAEMQEKEGAIAKSSLYDLVAQRSSNEVSVINQENQLNLSMLQLKQLLQIATSEPFELSQPNISIDESMMVQTKSVDEIYSISKKNLPQIKSAELNIKSAEYALKSAKGNYMPVITANLGLNTNYSSFADDRQRFVADGGDPIIIANPQVGYLGDSEQTPVYSLENSVIPSGEVITGYNVGDQFSDNLSRSFNLRISIPIFNGNQARANVQRTLIQKKQAEISSKETRNTLRQSIETANNNVLAAAKSYKASLKQVQAQEEAYRNAQKRHELKAISNIDYQIAENNLFQAKSDLLRAKYDYILKLKIIDFYQGNNIDY